MEKSRSRMAVPLFCLGVSALLLLVCTKSSPLYPLNDWVDVNIYRTIGSGMFRGLVPYRDLFDQKGPYAFLLYGVASLLTPRSYFGAYLLETLSFAGFLYYSYRTVRLYAGKRAYLCIPLLAGLILPAMSVSHGGSLEEFVLLPYAYSMYALLNYFRTAYPAPVRLRVVFVNGLLAGVLLFSKFTLLAFYFVWMALVFFSQLKKGRVARAFALCGVFLCAMALSGVPWLVYFGLNGALPEFFTHYFYNNLFGYSYLEPPVLPNMLLAVVRGTGATLYRNLQYGFLILLGVPYLLLSKKTAVNGWERAFPAAAAALTAFGAFCGGQGYRYYGLVLAVFCALGCVPLGMLAGRFLRRLDGRRWPPVFAGLLTAAALGFSLLFSSNVYMLLERRQDTPQYRFAEEMRALSGGAPVTLLCRACPDGGFYYAADALPTCRLFAATNIPVEGYGTVQEACIDSGAAEFVITRDCDIGGDHPNLTLVDTFSYYYEDYDRVYRLYQQAGSKE